MVFKTVVVSFIGLLILAAAFFFMFTQKNETSSRQEIITINTTSVVVDLATTTAAREQGLSGHASLSEGRGMLFVFSQDGNWGFWMKDMLFSLDIIWINNNGKIVTIAPSLSPATFPQSFFPMAPARYVLEMPAGFAAKHTITVGTQVTIPFIPSAQ